MKSLILLFCGLAINSPAGHPPPNDTTLARQSAHAKRAMIVPCLSENDVAKSLIVLSLPETHPAVRQVKHSLLGNARRSPQCRKRVVSTLITAMDKANLGSLQDEGDFFLWRNGAELLADLPAFEALDFLIANLGRTDDLSISMSHYPAVVGVIRMGTVSIPKLQLVLEQNPERYMRKFAVFCIASIGGSAAKRVLTQALPGETDKCVSGFIRASLDAFANKERPNQISASENVQWSSAFYCRGE